MASLQDFQDATLLITAYEQGSHNSTTEASAYVPVARIVNLMTDEMKAMQNAFTPDDVLLEQIMLAGSGEGGEIRPKDLGIDPKLVPELDDDSSAGMQVDVDLVDISKEMSSTKATEYAMAWMRDCIPCDKRAESFLKAAPDLPLDMLEAILKDLQHRLNFLSEILDLFNDKSVYNDLCSLASFLSFQCVPDLNSMLAFLAFMIAKWNMAGAKNINMLPGYWMGQMFYMPFLMSLYAVIARFLNQAFGVVECVTKSLQRQMEKMDVRPGMNRIFKNLDKEEPFKKKKEDTAQGQLGQGLSWLDETLRGGQRFLVDEMKGLGNELKSMLGMGGDLRGGLVDYVKTKTMLSRMIGVVRWMVEMSISFANEDTGGWDVEANAGGSRGLRVKCGEPNSEYDNMLNEVKRFFNDVADMKVEVDDDGNIVWTSVPDPEQLELAGKEWAENFVTKDDETEAKRSLDLDASDVDSKGLGVKIAEMAEARVITSCPGLQDKLSRNDAATLQKWMTDLMRD